MTTKPHDHDDHDYGGARRLANVTDERQRHDALAGEYRGFFMLVERREEPPTLWQTVVKWLRRKQGG
jgi:hypothetical protein